jgi:lysylphosphatidylglycerol synthetase-like protein (DUF2156 family)
MKPPLSPAHGTSLGTTAGITAVITLVAALSLLGQCSGLSGAPAVLAACAVTALLFGAAMLYAGRNDIGQSLDLAAHDAPAAGRRAARGLARFHLGMAGVFAGGGCAAAFRLALPHGGVAWLAPIAALAATVVALLRAASWALESRRRPLTAPRTGP